MRTFKFAAFIIAAILSCGFITSCGDDKDEPKPETTTPGGSNNGGGSQQGSEMSIFGTWSGTYEDEGQTFQQHVEWIFNSDNTCVMKESEGGYIDTYVGTYTVYGNLASGATLEFTYFTYTDFGETTYTDIWSIRINGNTAIMTDEYGGSATLTRR